MVSAPARGPPRAGWVRKTRLHLPQGFPGRGRGSSGSRKAPCSAFFWRGGLRSSAFVVVVELIEQAAAIRLEWPVINARRPAGIGRGGERFAALSLRVVADDEVARDQIDLLPMVVHERRGGVDAGIEAQQPCAAAHLAAFVEVARENF